MYLVQFTGRYLPISVTSKIPSYKIKNNYHIFYNLFFIFTSQKMS